MLHCSGVINLANAQFSLTTMAAPNTFTLDAIPNTEGADQVWTNDLTLVDAFAFRKSPSTSAGVATTVIRASDGDYAFPATQDVKLASLGATGSTERSLGFYTSKPNSFAVGSGELYLQFQNNTGAPIDILEISLAYERWRLVCIGNTDITGFPVIVNLSPFESISFQYQLGQASSPTGSWTTVGGLGHSATPPVHVRSGIPVADTLGMNLDPLVPADLFTLFEIGSRDSVIDGNLPANRFVKAPQTINLSSSLAPGAFITFRFNVNNAIFNFSGSPPFADATMAMGIDDIVITPRQESSIDVVQNFINLAETDAPDTLKIAYTNTEAFPQTFTLRYDSLSSSAEDGVDLDTIGIQILTLLPNTSDTLRIPIEPFTDCISEFTETARLRFEDIPAGVNFIGSTFLNVNISNSGGGGNVGDFVVMNGTATDPNLEGSLMFPPAATNQTARLILQSSSLSDTINSAQITFPSNWSGLSASNVSLLGPGFGPGALVSVVGNDIFVNNAEIVGGPDTIEITGLNTPNPAALDTDYTGLDTFFLQTAAPGCPLAPVADNKQGFANTIVPIKNVRRAYIAGKPCGRVAVTGTANCDRGILVNQLNRLTFGLQDDYAPHSGIMVFTFSSFWTPGGFPVTEGDSIVILGNMDEFQCYLEVVPLEAGSNGYINQNKSVLNLGPSSTPIVPLVKTMAEYGENPVFWQHMLIRMNNIKRNESNTQNYASNNCLPLTGCGPATCPSGSYFGGGSGCNVMVNDGTVPGIDIQMYMHPPSCASKNEEPCWPIDLVGLGVDYKNGAVCGAGTFGVTNCNQLDGAVELFMRKPTDLIPAVHDTVRWIGTKRGGDGINWNDPLNWCNSSVPGPSNVVIIENTPCTNVGDIDVYMPNTPVTVKALHLISRNYFSTVQEVNLHFADSCTIANNLTLTDPDTALIMVNNASIINANSHPTATNEVINVSAGGVVRMKYNSKYEHATVTSDVDMVSNLVADTTSTIEYNMPAATNVLAPGVTGSITFGNLIFSANTDTLGFTANRSYAWQGPTSVNITVLGDFTDSAGVSVVNGQAAGETMTFYGDLNNLSTHDAFALGAGGFTTFNPVFFRGSAVQNITGQDVNTFEDVTINNTSFDGVVTDVNLRVGSASTNSQLNLLDGKLTTTGTAEVIVPNGNTNAVTGFAVAGSVASASYVNGRLRRAIGGNGQYAFPVGTTNNYEHTSLNFSQTGSLSDVLVFFNQSSPGLSGLPLTENGADYDDILNAGFWSYLPNPAVGYGPVNYTLRMDETGYSNGAKTSYTNVKRSNGASPWSLLGTFGSFNETPAFTVVSATRFAVTTFSDGAIATSEDIVLPVELLGFAGVYDPTQERVNLSWETTNEKNASHFDVQRSVDLDGAFTTIATVEAAGNAADVTAYELDDYDLPSVDTWYYRLQQFDQDGSFAYSNTVEVKRADLGNSVSLYPNPFDENLTLSFAYPPSGAIGVKVFDIAGKVVFEENVTENALSGARYVLKLSDLAKGSYLVSLTLDGETQNHKVTKTR